MDFLIFCAFIIVLAIVCFIEAVMKGSFKVKLPNVTIAHDGHIIPKEKDISCENQFHHFHGPTFHETNIDNSRYIVHEEPETGYVILNGVKRKISDCKDL